MRHEFEAILANYAERFPEYRKHIPPIKGGRDPGSVPLMTDTLLQAIYYSQDLGHLSGANRYMTSGTISGIRKAIYYSPSDEARYLENRTRIFRDFLGSGLERAASDLGTGHACQTAETIFRSMGMEPKSIEHTLPIDRHIEILNAFRPDVLFTMPMILDRLINHPKADFRPSKLIVVGDVATQAWKGKVAQYFGMGRKDILDIVGSIEIGSIASECHACGRYHFEEDLYPEVIPADRLDEGHAAGDEVLVLSSRSREYFPAMRYVTYDLVRGFSKTECGGGLRHSFDRMTGRIGKDIKHGEKVSQYDIATAIALVMGPVPFRVVQNAGHIEILLESESLDLSSAQSIRDIIGDKNPDIKQMIDSGILGQIKVGAVQSGAFPKVFKREARAGV